MRIIINPAPEEFEAEDSFEEFIASQFPVGTRVRVSADGVVWDGTITNIETDSEPEPYDPHGGAKHRDYEEN